MHDVRAVAERQQIPSALPLERQVGGHCGVGRVQSVQQGILLRRQQVDHRCQEDGKHDPPQGTKTDPGC